MEHNAVTNSQYSRLETIELSPVPAEIREDILEESICKALSLTGVNVVPEDLHACHRMKSLDRVIVKFKCPKQKQSLKKNYGPFLWMGFSTASRLEPLRGGSLLFTTKFPEIPGTHFIGLGRMKGGVDLGATQWF